MYVFLGNSTVIRDSDIIGIFDIENTSVGQITKDYLTAAGKRKSAEYVSYEMPKAFITAMKDGKEKVYITNVSPSTITNRCTKQQVAPAGTGSTGASLRRKALETVIITRA